MTKEIRVFFLLNYPFLFFSIVKTMDFNPPLPFTFAYNSILQMYAKDV